MSELSPEARALLASTRDGDDPSERDRARMRQRMSLALAAASAGLAASAAAPAAATTAASAAATATATATKAGIGAQVAASVAAPVAASTLTAKISVAVTVAVISVAGSGVVLKHERAAEESARKPIAAAMVAAPRVEARKRARLDQPDIVPGTEAVVPEVPVAAPLVVEPLPAPVVRVERLVHKPMPARRAKAPEPASDVIPLSLQNEIQLLSFAQAALREGEHERALASLAEHAARFPNGALALERDAVRAITLCSSGRTAAGQRVAVELAPRIASSPLAARLERACDLGPPAGEHDGL